MFRKKKKRVRLPLRAYLLYLALMSFLLTGVTFSKYVAQSSGGDSARVVRYGTVEITEDVPANGWAIVPGVGITKNATVNVSASEVVNYIFLKVDSTGWTVANDNRSFYGINSQVRWSIPAEWIYLSGSGNSIVYYLELAPNTDLAQSAIAGNYIAVDNTITEAELSTYAAGLSIDFTAYMVQGGGFADAAAAWNAIND